MTRHSADTVVLIVSLVLMVAAMATRGGPPWWKQFGRPLTAVPGITLWGPIAVCLAVFVAAVRFVPGGTSAPPAPIAWQRFHSATGGYSIELPSGAIEEMFSDNVGLHPLTGYRAVGRDESRDCSFLVVYRGPVTGMTFDATRAATDLVRRTGGTLLSDEPVVVDGHVGRRVFIRRDDGHTLTAVVLPNQGGLVTVFSLVPHDLASDPQVQLFHQSFHFDTYADDRW